MSFSYQSANRRLSFLNMWKEAKTRAQGKGLCPIHGIRTRGSCSPVPTSTCLHLLLGRRSSNTNAESPASSLPAASEKKTPASGNRADCSMTSSCFKMLPKSSRPWGLGPSILGLGRGGQQWECECQWPCSGASTCSVEAGLWGLWTNSSHGARGRNSKPRSWRFT